NDDHPLDPLRFCAPYQCRKCKRQYDGDKNHHQMWQTVRLKFRRVVHSIEIPKSKLQYPEKQLSSRAKRSGVEGSRRVIVRSAAEFLDFARNDGPCRLTHDPEITRNHIANPSNIARKLLNRLAIFRQ